MGKRKGSFSGGTRVAHREIDDEIGSAKTGVVDQVIGDDEHELVVVKEEDGRRTAYDHRELVSLGAVERSSGPVILHMRHLVSLFRRLPALLSLALAVVAGVALNVLSHRGDWSPELTAAVGVGMIIVCFILFVGLERTLAPARPKEE